MDEFTREQMKINAATLEIQKELMVSSRKAMEYVERLLGQVEDLQKRVEILEEGRA